MPILYDNPKEVGADRIADAVGAFDLYGGPTIVVDFGTATTVEADLARKGEYLGGAIFPGIEISMDALFGRAAALRRVELVDAAQRDRQVDGRVDPVGRDLRLQRPGRRHRATGSWPSSATCTVVATGGLAELIMPFSRTIQHHEPWLTLHGLRIIFERNASDGRSARPRGAGARSPSSLRRRGCGARRRPYWTARTEEPHARLDHGNGWRDRHPCRAAARGAARRHRDLRGRLRPAAPTPPSQRVPADRPPRPRQARRVRGRGRARRGRALRDLRARLAPAARRRRSGTRRRPRSPRSAGAARAGRLDPRRAAERCRRVRARARPPRCPRRGRAGRTDDPVRSSVPPSRPSRSTSAGATTCPSGPRCGWPPSWARTCRARSDACCGCPPCPSPPSPTRCSSCCTPTTRCGDGRGSRSARCVSHYEASPISARSTALLGSLLRS